MAIIGFLLVLLLLPMLRSYVAKIASVDESASKIELKPTESCLSISDVSFDKKVLSTAVIGKATNNCRAVIGLGSVEFNILGMSGSQIETASASTTNLPPGRVWKFRAALARVEGDFAVSFELAKVTAQK